MLLAHVLAATTLLAFETGPTAPGQASFQVIVHRSNPVTAMSRAQLSAVFMKKLLSWPDRSPIIPVDQRSASRVREQFSRSVHGKSTAYVVRYWHRVIFAGRGIPPQEAQSDEGTIRLVRTHRGAIGYVGTEGVLPEDVRVIEVRP